MVEDEIDDLADHDDYRQDPSWRMENIKELVSKDRSDTDIIVQHPIRESAPEESDVKYFETMGLSVGPPSPKGVFTISNTSVDTQVTERFVALDVGMVDDLIDALEEVKARHAGDETFTCPCCETRLAYPNELEQKDDHFVCPECEYHL